MRGGLASERQVKGHRLGDAALRVEARAEGRRGTVANGSALFWCSPTVPPGASHSRRLSHHR
jgi:hypothetical protein